MPDPSPITNPSRLASKGRTALVGVLRRNAEMRIVEGHAGGRVGEVDETVVPPHLPLFHIGGRVKVADFSGHRCVKPGGIKPCNAPNPALPSHQARPERVFAGADWADDPNAGDDNPASRCHRLFPCSVQITGAILWRARSCGVRYIFRPPPPERFFLRLCLGFRPPNLPPAPSPTR